MPNVLCWYAKCSLNRSYRGGGSVRMVLLPRRCGEWLALGTGALLLFIGASRQSAVGAWLAVSSAPFTSSGSWC